MVAGGGLVRAIGVRPGRSVAAVGAGGKTSLLTALAKEFHARSGGPALLTTTTRVFAPRPEEKISLTLGDIDALSGSLRSRMEACGVSWFARGREGIAPVPGREHEGRMKLRGFAPAEIARLRLEDGLTLIEADGARRLPVKAPGAREPVMPEGVDVVLGVVGLDALGAPLDEAHAFRPELLSRICRLDAGEEITAEAIGRLCAHPEGLFHKAESGARKWIVVNKADLEASVEKLRKIAYTVQELAGRPHGPADGVLVTSCLKNECEVFLRTTPEG